MNKGVALVGGLGLGAALMYVFDPDRGKRRRAMIRDKVDSTAHRFSDKAEKMGRDIGNRAYGMIAETKSMFRHEEASDDVLVHRVQARLGRLPVHIGAFDVTAHDGIVTLRGEILSEELTKVLRAARFVRGVKAVDNRLSVRENANSALSLPDQPQPSGV